MLLDLRRRGLTLNLRFVFSESRRPAEVVALKTRILSKPNSTIARAMAEIETTAK
jgi:hypothetical protein